jgi:signal transduction histidine kinase
LATEIAGKNEKGFVNCECPTVVCHVCAGFFRIMSSGGMKDYWKSIQQNRAEFTFLRYHSSMRTFDSPYIADWFAISFRWMAILGLTVSLSMGDQLLLPRNLLLLGLTAWNLILTFIAGINRRFDRHREISLVLDLVAAGLLFWLQGGLDAPAFWVVLIPILSAGIYFELVGAMGAAVLMTALLVLVTFMHYPWQQALPISLVAAVVTLLNGLVFGFLGRKAIHSLRRIRLKNQDTQQRERRFENERLRAIYNLTSTLVATLNYQRVLESVLDMSMSALTADRESQTDDRLVSAVLLFSKEGKLEVASARRLSATDMRIVLPCQKGALAKAVEEGEPVLFGNIAADPELVQMVTLHSCNQVYCFPLRSGFSVYGLLLFGHPTPGFFNQERLDILDILSRQAVIAIQNARLYQNLADERDRMVEIHEEARKKLARDLHDGPTQSVSAIAMRVNLARIMLDKDVKKTAEELIKIEDLARRTTKEIRHMLFTLRPLILESQGLVAALQASAEKMKETFSQNVVIKVDEKLLEEIEMGKQGVIFYLVEEAVNNARKHAQATHIWVRLQPVEREIALLEIQDDGVGFNVAEINRAYDERGSLGMVNLRERTELVNGFLNILSAPGKGTKIQVFIPLSEDAADHLHRAIGKK